MTMTKTQVEFDIDGLATLSWELRPGTNSVVLELGLPGMPPAWSAVIGMGKGEDPRQAMETAMAHLRAWLKQVECTANQSAETTYPMLKGRG